MVASANYHKWRQMAQSDLLHSVTVRLRFTGLSCSNRSGELGNRGRRDPLRQRVDSVLP